MVAATIVLKHNPEEAKSRSQSEAGAYLPHIYEEYLDSLKACSKCHVPSSKDKGTLTAAIQRLDRLFRKCVYKIEKNLYKVPQTRAQRQRAYMRRRAERMNTATLAAN